MSISKKYILLALAVFFVFGLNAQPGGGGNPGGGEPVPITGIEILLAAGGALGFWKFFSSKKKH